MNRRIQRLRKYGIALGAGILPLIAQGRDMWCAFGPVIRGGMDVKISGSSYAQTLTLDGLGDPNAYDDRTYDDGYVKKDSSNGGGIAPNTTWNWGYHNAGQYNATAGAQTLTFQKQGIPRYSGGGEDSMLAGGLQLSFGLPLTQSGKWGFDLVFGLQGVWGDSKFRENAAYVTVMDTYNVADIIPFPAAGHRGTFNGPFDPAATPPYTVIPNLSVTRNEIPFVGAAPQSGIAISVDQGLCALSVGPQISFAAGSRFTLHVTPRISCNVMDVTVERSEVFVFANGTGARQWSDRADKTRVTFGAGAIAGADLDLGKGWYAGVLGGYEWVLEETKVRVGPNTVSLDASGWLVGLTVGKRF